MTSLANIDETVPAFDEPVLNSQAPMVCNTVKPVNKGHLREKQYMVFIDKWPLFGGYIVLLNLESITEEWPLFTGWS